MKRDIFDLITQNYRIYTAVQIGLDDEVSPILAARFDYVQYLGLNTEWSRKVSVDYDNTTTDLYDSDEDIFEHFDYFNQKYDLAYINNNVNIITARSLFLTLVRDMTKFIVVHPSINILYNCSGESYMKTVFDSPVGLVSVYHLDVLRHVINEEKSLRARASESNESIIKIPEDTV